MRFNDFQTDPYSNKSSTASICARGDLSVRPRASGCYGIKQHEKEHILILISVSVMIWNVLCVCENVYRY
jgi:hypothetical protein